MGNKPASKKVSHVLGANQRPNTGANPNREWEEGASKKAKG